MPENRRQTLIFERLRDDDKGSALEPDKRAGQFHISEMRSDGDEGNIGLHEFPKPLWIFKRNVFVNFPAGQPTDCEELEKISAKDLQRSSGDTATLRNGEHGA